jgi:flagellar biosynthesis/type III secretory pathway ATPase
MAKTGNYRPISVLPAVSKVMERILYDQLYDYLTKFQLLNDLAFANLTQLLQRY